MPSLTESESGRKTYWRSLNELGQTPEFRKFLESEFPNLAREMSGASRRRFLQIMGASFALAGAAGCRWPKENITPYARRPQNRTPGVPVHYATASEREGVATGLLVRSYDGRPIKVEGNPLHPDSLGGAGSLEQAAILELYDPDRSTQARQRTGQGATARPTEAALAALRAAVNAQRSTGARLAILSEASGSLILAEARDRLMAACPQARWFEYEPLSRDNARGGTRMATGRPLRPHTNFDQADVIVSFDEDFLHQHPAASANTRRYAAHRTADDGTMNRHYQIESTYSLTGANADHRYAEKPSDVPIRLLQLAAALHAAHVRLPADLVAQLGDLPEAPAYIKEIAGDLHQHAGHAAILVGPRQAPAAHAVAVALNAALGGEVVTYTAEGDPQRGSHMDNIRTLAGLLERGEVDTVVILGGNPVYTAPADLDFGAKLAKAGLSVHLSLFDDETSARCTWHVPAAHYLERWDIVRGWDGTASIGQPLIAPLYGGLTPAELLDRSLGGTADGYTLTRARFNGAFGSDQKKWESALHEGVIAGTAAARVTPTLSGDWSAIVPGARRQAGGEGYELIFAADKLHDGRYANNAWLQELPDPLTKLTWDNAALLSPNTARDLDVRQDDVLAIEVDGRKLSLPAFILPGHADGAITLPLGYGRTAAGGVGDGMGVDTYRLRTSGSPYLATGASVRKTRQTYQLATTQDHHAIESEVGNQEVFDRAPKLIREVSLATYKADPHAVAHLAHSLPLVQPFGDHAFPDKHRWGMTIDLAKCTGCSACVTACQAENNIPVVGKREIIMGREMHWMRIDRYYSTTTDEMQDLADPSKVQVRQQPVTCVQCENAPCEQVCPVAATVHDQEGLNVMVYNRCIGTRYCLNNCPYKVRRFNWFWNHHGPYHPRSDGEWAQQELYEVQKLGFNPEVTVRSRGVMEKCTYCTQRIAAVRIAARNEQREIAEGEIMTACQQACPADAIAFGDLRERTHRVAREQESDRAYVMLEDLNIRPRTKYLAALRNPLHDTPAGGHGGGHDAGHDDHGHEADGHAASHS